jgi:hypothetical protein
MVAGSSPTRRSGSILKEAPWISPTSRSRLLAGRAELSKRFGVRRRTALSGCRARARARVAGRREAMFLSCVFCCTVDGEN